MLLEETVCGSLFKWKQECKYRLRRDCVEESQTAVLRKGMGLDSGGGPGLGEGPESHNSRVQYRVSRQREGGTFP